MKAIDIATRNHISIEDMLEVCKELEIGCDNGTAELTEKEVFLIEKKIEAIKNRKLKAMEKSAVGKKIKLKRKVQISKETKDKHTVDAVPEKTEKTEATAEAPQPPPRRRPEGDQQRPQGQEGYQGQRPQGQGQGYQGQRPQGQGQGYQGQRPQGQGQGYQGQRPQGQGQGYQGQRPQGQGQGYQGQRPQGQGQGYQGQRPQGQGQGYQGQRPGGGPGDRGRPFTGDRRPQQKRSDGDILKDLTGTPPVTPVAAVVEGKDVSKKRKKGKEKEKEPKWKKKTPEEKDFIVKKKAAEAQRRRELAAPTEISITENISVGDLSKKLNIKANEVIAKLMKLGVMVTINQIIDAETAEILAGEYGTNVRVVSLYDETVIKHDETDKQEDYVHRPPVVTVMGHVDHGKTKLLDAIRKTNVIASEHGGITQHIGAYMVDVHGKKITFLDTPGHAAFTTMRARGAKITDIVILVVAADDGVMPQTIEAINHAKAAKVPIIVAINKIDLPNANIKKVRDMLAVYDLIPEEWGGTTLYAEISAKQNTKIDELLELILIQAEMLELKANPLLQTRGTVIESKLDPGRGSVSTILIQNGTLRVGDSFVVGVFNGKVRAMFNDKGEPITEAGPSTPVEVIGISGVPSAGDPFEGVEMERMAKQVSQKRLEYRRIETAKKVRKVTLESLNEMIKEGEVQELPIIVKADVDGSSQALTEALEKLSTGEVRVKVIHTGTGGINESDVMLASASNAIIIGYHVRPTGRVSDLAGKENVSIKFYNIIFEATDDIRAAMQGMLAPEIKEEITGTGEVRQVFKISKLGTVAGAVVLSGKVQRSNKMRLIREGVVVYEGNLKSLKRFKDDASEIDSGQEFGFGFDGFNDIREGDTFETYKLIEIAKTL